MPLPCSLSSQDFQANLLMVFYLLYIVFTFLTLQDWDELYSKLRFMQYNFYLYIFCIMFIFFNCVYIVYSFG